MLKCTTCKLLKSQEDFTKSKEKRRYAYRCKQCDKQYRKENKEYIKDYQFKYKFGISLKEYNDLLESQNHQCAICKSTCLSGRSLAVDHCHLTLKVRGLLCIPCNQGLGSFRDSKKLLNNAISYLGKYQ